MKNLRAWPWQRVLTLGLSLKARVILGTFLPVVAIAGFFAHNLQTQKQLTHTTHEILDHRIMMMHAAERVKEGLVSYDDALFRYLAVQDPDQFLESEHWKKQAQENLARLRQFSTSPLIQERLDILQHESDQYFMDAEQLVQYARKTQMSASLLQRASRFWTRETGQEHLELAFLSAEGKARLVRVFSLCEEITTINRLELERAQADMDRVLRDAKRTGAILSALATGSIALLAGGFVLSLFSALKSLLQGIRQMEKGNLSTDIPVMTNDEVGELTEAFNHAARLIREQREQLLHETITDGLTGVYNQRHFRKILHQETERAHRSGEPLSILMIDVDRFKDYNDTFGHEFGNEILRKISALILDTIREIDILARYGGDEFAVILPRTSAEQSLVLAERILAGVAMQVASKTQAEVTVPKLTVSIGGASFPKDSASAEDLVRRADAALYGAKKAGRARVLWARGRDPGASPLEVAP
jgi:diguanylate cyclase (GGDEF)-like protein